MRREKSTVYEGGHRALVMTYTDTSTCIACGQTMFRMFPGGRDGRRAARVCAECGAGGVRIHSSTREAASGITYKAQSAGVSIVCMRLCASVQDDQVVRVHCDVANVVAGPCPSRPGVCACPSTETRDGER